MISMRVLCLVAFFSTLAVTAQAECIAPTLDGTYHPDEALVGKSIWLASNDNSILPAFLGSHEGTVPLGIYPYTGFTVPVLKQVGTHKWEPDGKTTLPQGLKATVTRVVEPDDLLGYVRYLAIDPGDGSEVVVSDLNVVHFDFTQCKASEILYELNPGSSADAQWLDGIPMKMKKDSRPVDMTGKWLETVYLSICAIPEHCIDARRLPLFIARSALRDLIAGLHADAKGVQTA